MALCLKPHLPLRTRVLSGVVCVSFLGSTLAAAQSPPAVAPQGQPAASAQTTAATAAAASVQPQPPSAKQQVRANDAYIAGARALDHRDYPAAEKHFAHALELYPGNRNYLTALALAREHHVTDLAQQAGRLRLEGHPEKAAPLVAEAQALDPTNAIVLQHLPLTEQSPEPWLTEGPTFAGAIVLTPISAVKSYHLCTDLQDLIRRVANDYGIRAVFDDSVQRKSVRFDIDDVSYHQVMPILFEMRGLFAVPLDQKSILIARDTAENRQRLERQMQETIHAPGLTSQQMSELGNVVRNIFNVRQATLENNLGDIVLRAPEPTLKAVNLTLNDLIDNNSEVLLELKLYSVSLTHNRVTGLSLPQQVGAYNVASQAQSLVSQNQSLVNQAIAQGLIPANASTLQIAEYLLASGVVTSSLLTSTIGIFGGGFTTTGVYATNGATLNLGLTSSEVRSIDDIQLRVTDREHGVFRIGTRYPITTSTYSTGVTGNTSSLAGVNINGVSASSLLSQYLGSGSGVTIPQIQYEDLGLTLDATPHVLQDGTVHLTFKFKIEALGTGSLNNIPVLDNQQFESEVTVPGGDSALILSNLNRSEMRAISGTPGLAELPGFQDASQANVEADSSQLVMILTPHVIRHRRNPARGPRIFLPLERAAASSPASPEPEPAPEPPSAPPAPAPSPTGTPLQVPPVPQSTR